MSRLLICTDLDRTLIPNGSQPESPDARQRFSRFVNRKQITLAYVSGRHRQLIEQAIKEYQLPMPDYAIADVGSTIYRIEQGTWHPWQAWSDEIGGDWQGLSREKMHALLSDIDALKLQEVEKQNIHKLSYYLPLQHDQQGIIDAIQARLHAKNVQANVIWSVDELKGVGLLDILPAGANKLHAIRFLMQQKGYDESETIFAGDSGNDLDVLLSPVQSVLVANADDEVRRAVEGASAATLYLASGALLNMNGNYSAGILEGVAHYRPDLLSLIEGEEL